MFFQDGAKALTAFLGYGAKHPSFNISSLYVLTASILWFNAAGYLGH